MALVPSVRWPCSGAFARARSCHFQKNMPPEKPKWCVEDDEDVGKEVPYLCPVAGHATGEGVAVSFPCHQPLAVHKKKKPRLLPGRG